MVTQAQLHEHLGRRPFRPFRVRLTDGETIDIVRTAQAVASSRQFIVGMIEEDRFRWIQLDKIDRIEATEPDRSER